MNEIYKIIKENFQPITKLFLNCDNFFVYFIDLNFSINDIKINLDPFFKLNK